MKFMLITTIFGLGASITSATISLGVLNGNHVAWIDGADQCATNVVINPVSQNPCPAGVGLASFLTHYTPLIFSVNLDNTGSHNGYSESRCGGEDYILLQNGQFNSECHFDKVNIACPQGGLQQQFSCF
ncbi:hypothetical protein N431DRAFT_456775 [Stipitochalara longipes BDJ]|nr:hypothetical protein N431DRAFT_456775 [Stipitochalara longipes BDJ]